MNGAINDDLFFHSKLIENELLKKNLLIHIRIQQRNTKKYWTLIEGLTQIGVEKDKKFLKKILKMFREKLHCSVTLKKPENVIQLQGDHREAIKNILIVENLANKEQIKIYG